MRTRLAVGLVALGLLAAPGAVWAQGASPAGSPIPLGQPTVAGRPPVISVQYVGPVEGSELYAAVIDTGSGVQVYLCDGDAVGLWFTGSHDGDVFTASADDGSTVTGTLDGTSATGTATLADGTSLALDLPHAVPPAGFYTRDAVTDDGIVTSRTIVLPNGTAKGLAAPTAGPVVSDAHCWLAVGPDFVLIDTDDFGTPNVPLVRTIAASDLAFCQHGSGMLVAVIAERKNALGGWQTLDRDTNMKQVFAYKDGITAAASASYRCPAHKVKSIVRATGSLAYVLADGTQGALQVSTPEVRTAC